MAITIKDVAKKAGVSTTTVSKVLNNVPTISEATASRIKEIMKEMDYHPNRRAQNFARQSTRTILLVTSLEKNAAFENPHMFETMVGLQNALSKKNYSLNIVGIRKDNGLDVLRDVITQKSVDGIVLHISIITKELENLIIEADFPNIVLGCPEYKTQLCWIDNDNTLSGELAAKHLLSIGYNTIGFIGGRKNDIGSTCRLEGVKHVLDQQEVTVENEYVQLGESSIESGYEMMNKLLKSKDKPDAVVCANNYLALGAFKAIQASGIKIPEDIGIVTFDAYPFTKTTDPNLTTIDIDVYDLGKQAGESILQILKKPNLKIQTYRTLATLIENGSTK